MHHRYWLGDLTWQNDHNKSSETWVHVSGRHQIVAYFWIQVIGYTNASGSVFGIKGIKRKHTEDDDLGTISIDKVILHLHVVLSYMIQISKMQVVKFIVAFMPLAILASPIEQHGADLVGREAAPDALVEAPGFTERSDEPNELFRRKCHQYSQGCTDVS